MGLFGRWYLAAVVTVIALIFVSAAYGDAQRESLQPLEGMTDCVSVLCSSGIAQ
jgi:hypothetical protein